MQEKEYINVYGARVHNLKNIDAEIPRDSLTVITGLSGSGNHLWHLTPSLLKDNAGILKRSPLMHVTFWEIWSDRT
jgi:ABC-type lipoprotein export system ATPase subunit